MSNELPPILGGTSLTVVRVYTDREAPDGLFSGCPHVHGLTDEAYFVTAGSGRVELQCLARGLRTVPLRRGDYLQFPPHVLHRLISDERLEVLALIGNAGLAERGDARIWFGRAVDEDPEAYRELASLPQRKGLEGALERRDRAVQSYLQLRELWSTDRAAWEKELARFIDVHLNQLASGSDMFQSIITQGPRAASEHSLQRAVSLPRMIDGEPVTGVSQAADDAEPMLGMCGRLRQIDHLARV